MEELRRQLIELIEDLEAVGYDQEAITAIERRITYIKYQLSEPTARYNIVRYPGNDKLLFVSTYEANEVMTLHTLRWFNMYGNFVYGVKEATIWGHMGGNAFIRRDKYGNITIRGNTWNTFPFNKVNDQDWVNVTTGEL